MKTFVSQLPGRQKLELLIWSVILFVSLCLISVDALDNIAKGFAPNKRSFAENGVSFLYYANYFYPLTGRYLVLFAGFLALNFWVLPKFFIQDSNAKPGWWLTGSFLLITVLLTLTYLGYSAYLFSPSFVRREALLQILKSGLLAALGLFLFTGIYNAVKGAIHFVLIQAPELEARYRFVNREGLLAFLAWFVSLLLVIVSRAQREIVIVWFIVGPSAILFYWAALYRMIPSVQGKKRAFLRYLFQTLVILFFQILIGGFALMLVMRHPDAGFAVASFNASFLLFIMAPLSWIVYKQKQKGKTELSTLKNALGQSTAHFDFLRSQINPHFLFNALNTIYGTALQEGADRTAEGVERLSSMMRFMLQENVQEKIALAREVEYLKNYIALQRLRTATHEGITLDIHIDEAGAEGYQISPMLLIPFVENAFKHGISFRSPSAIRISLEVHNNQLLFDVFNSRHDKSENDPEKLNNGIGLKNVQERLQLLYPQRHELTIRETARQFFVHLTLQLRHA